MAEPSLAIAADRDCSRELGMRGKKREAGSASGGGTGTRESPPFHKQKGVLRRADSWGTKGV